MKKLVNGFNKSVLAAGALGIFVSTVANADLGSMKFYAGAGLGYNMYSINKGIDGISNTSTKSKGINFLVPALGVKFNDNFGVEVGYGINKKLKTEGKIPNLVLPSEYKYSASVKLSNLYLDFIGFMPVAEQVELIGGIGLNKLSVKSSNENIVNKYNVPSIAAPEFKNKVSWRIKLGGQYNFNNNFAVRLTGVYQTSGSKVEFRGTKNKFIKNSKSIGLDAIYTF